MITIEEMEKRRKNEINKQIRNLIESVSNPIESIIRTDPVLVAIIDTGVDGNHPDLEGYVVAKANFSESDNADDRNEHGTNIAGIITRVAPECEIISVKVTDDRGRFDV